MLMDFLNLIVVDCSLVRWILLIVITSQLKCSSSNVLLMPSCLVKIYVATCYTILCRLANIPTSREVVVFGQLCQTLAVRLWRELL